MKSDHEALEAERHQSAKLCDEVGRLKAQIEITREQYALVKSEELMARHERDQLKAQLDQFHAAMEKEKSPEWSKELNKLADYLDELGRHTSTFTEVRVQEAARQLRYMADCFTHKANFVPMELALKEAQTDRDDARKEVATTLVQLGKVEDQRDEALREMAERNDNNFAAMMQAIDQRDECLGVLRVLQPQVKMWLAGSSEYEWIGKLLEGRFGEGIYKPK